MFLLLDLDPPNGSSLSLYQMEWWYLPTLFYGKHSLYIRNYRRGSTFELETDRPSFSRLYGMLLRPVAFKGGGPGRRWTYFQSARGQWKARPGAGSSDTGSSNFCTNIYEWNHLRYEGETPADDMYDTDDEDDRCSWEGSFIEHSVIPLPVQSG